MKPSKLQTSATQLLDELGRCLQDEHVLKKRFTMKLTFELRLKWVGGLIAGDLGILYHDISCIVIFWVPFNAGALLPEHVGQSCAVYIIHATS